MRSRLFRPPQLTKRQASSASVRFWRTLRENGLRQIGRSALSATRPLRVAWTYARRYALFTLVGIAGEDDLDAPDLLSPAAPETKTDSPTRNKKDRLNGGQDQSGQRFWSGRSPKPVSGAVKPVLEPEVSAALRDQLVAELNELNSAEEAANWAHRVMPSKNSLIEADAALIEQAFQAKLGMFVGGPLDEVRSPHAAEWPSMKRGWKRRRSTVIDKAVLALPAPRWIRDRDHVKSVAKQPCLVCGRRPADAHHLQFTQSRALGRKVSDEFTIPLCRGHHREVHHCGDEAAWWEKAGIDPTVSARQLWLKTHPLPPTPDHIELECADSGSAVRRDQPVSGGIKITEQSQS
jgi:hypothetical protein